MIREMLEARKQPKNKRLEIRLGEPEYGILEELCRKNGQNKSEIIRNLILMTVKKT